MTNVKVIVQLQQVAKCECEQIIGQDGLRSFRADMQAPSYDEINKTDGAGKRLN